VTDDMDVPLIRAGGRPTESDQHESPRLEMILDGPGDNAGRPRLPVRPPRLVADYADQSLSIERTVLI